MNQEKKRIVTAIKSKTQFKDNPKADEIIKELVDEGFDRELVEQEVQNIVDNGSFFDGKEFVTLE